MLDSIYHMTLKLLKITFLALKLDFFPLLCKVIMEVITYRYSICQALVVYRLYCMALYHSQTRGHLISTFFLFFIGLTAEGLYRVAGLHDEVEEIRMAFDKGKSQHFFYLFPAIHEKCCLSPFLRGNNQPHSMDVANT